MNSNSVSIREVIEQQKRKKLRQLRFQQQQPSINIGDDADGLVENPETAIQKLKYASLDLKENINYEQEMIRQTFHSGTHYETTTPMLYFCYYGELPMIRFLKLHGASCTQRDRRGWFPMFVAVYKGNLKTIQWLYDFGGDARYDINKENPNPDYRGFGSTLGCGSTPLSASIYYGYVSQAQWLIRKGGAQGLSEQGVRELRSSCSRDISQVGYKIISWARMNIVFHDTTFFLFLCGAKASTITSTHRPTTINDAINTTASSSSVVPVSSSSSSSSLMPPYNDIANAMNQHITNTGGGRLVTSEEAASIIQSARASAQASHLQLLNGHPGIMELIGNYAGLIHGKEMRILKEFNDLMKGIDNADNDVGDDSEDHRRVRSLFRCFRRSRRRRRR